MSAVLGQWEVTGSIGTLILGVTVTIDDSTNPRKVGVGFTWEPRDSPDGKRLVSGPGGLIETLRLNTDLDDGALEYHAKSGRHWFPWTEVHRAGFYRWLGEWTGRGLSSFQVSNLVRELNRFTPTFIIPRVGRVTQSIGSIPPGSLIQINNVEHCSNRIWDQLRAVPGVFFLTASGNPVPVTSNWVQTWIERRGEKPTPAYVSAVHVDEVARLFPDIRAQQQQIRRDIGLDYPMYEARYFPIPGRDPSTGRNFHLYEYQAQGVSKFLAMRRIVFNVEMGLGKCHRKGQKLLMFDGSTKAVEYLLPGDRLMGPDSQPRTILSVNTGRGRMVRVTPKKGKPFVVNDDHILSLVHTDTSRAGKRGHYRNYMGGTVRDFSIRTILQWKWTPRNSYLMWKLFRVAVEFPPRPEPPMDPYFLGVLLGDGHLAYSDVAVTTMDESVRAEIYAQAEQRGMVVRVSAAGRARTYHLHQPTSNRPRLTNGSPAPNWFHAVLRHLGLMPIACADRFIPDEFKLGSTTTRRQVLAGLIDTDGSATGGCYDYISKSEQLANDVAFVARSLGLAAYVAACEKRDQHGHGGTYYRVCISGELAIVPCRVARKRMAKRRQKKDVLRTGFRLDYVSDDEEYYGFTLDGDGRYLLDDFTVTHNTLMGLAAAETLFLQRAIDRCVVISPRRAQRTVWERFLLMYYGRRAIVIDGGPKERRIQYARALRSQYVITRYDTWRLGDAQIGLASLLGPRTMVIVDECHRVKNQDTARHKAIFEMLEGTRWTGLKYERMPQWSTPYRLLMTGTMVHDKPLDVYGPTTMLGWRVWNSFPEFQRAYFHMATIRSPHVDKKTGERRVMMRATKLNPNHIPELQGILSAVTYTKTVADVGLQLPPITRVNLVIDPSPAELAAYRVIKGEVFRFLDSLESLQKKTLVTVTPEQQAALDAAKESLLATMAMERMFSSDPVLLLYSATQRDAYGRFVPGTGSETADRLVTQIGRDVLTALSPGSKLSALMEWLADFLQQGRGAKAVVFCSFQRLFQYLQQVVKTPVPGMTTDDYREFRYVMSQSLFFDGTVTDKQGDAVVRAFTNESRHRILFSTSAGGEGQNFQVADYVVHFDEPLSIGDLQQREARVIGGLRRAGGRPAFVSTMRFAPAMELRNLLDSRVARFVDPRIRALLAGKNVEKTALMRGIRS